MAFCISANSENISNKIKSFAHGEFNKVNIVNEKNISFKIEQDKTFWREVIN